MAKLNGRPQQLADWETRPAKDYDPEADVPHDSESDSGSGDSADEKAATEHYVNVGKSKLRRKDPVALGPRYRGARVSRADLEAQSGDGGGGESDEEPSENFEDAQEGLDGLSSSEYDDPDKVDLEADRVHADDDDDDAEIDSDNALGESDEERFKNFTFRGSSQALPNRGKRVTRPTAADFMGSDEGGEQDGLENESIDEDEEVSDEDEDEEEDIDSADDLRNGSASAFLDDEAEDDEDDEDEEDDEEDEELDGLKDDLESEQEEDGAEKDDDESEDDDEEIDTEQKRQKTSDANRASLQDMIQTGQRSMAESLSSAAQKDVAKGKAVKQQQKAFDALLNIRIRLQKSLIAVNSLHTAEETDNQSEPYEAAEAAALKLWNAIEGFRSSVQPGTAVKSGQKRKYTAEATMSSQEIWESMEDTERRAKSRRRAVLENWSQKAKNMRTVDRSARKFSSSAEKPLTVRLDEELQAPERLVKRTRTPRSCAPAQVARKVNEDPNIYDDADFYQLLLKELVDQRSADTSSGGAGGAGAGGSAAATVRFTAMKEAKAKRHVDTKASKGRKMRFNVHEKLQNFMAPEDRRSWGEGAIDRLFGTLFGQKMELDEDEMSSADEENTGNVLAEQDVGFRLFRG